MMLGMKYSLNLVLILKTKLHGHKIYEVFAYTKYLFSKNNLCKDYFHLTKIKI